MSLRSKLTRNSEFCFYLLYLLLYSYHHNHLHAIVAICDGECFKYDNDERTDRRDALQCVSTTCDTSSQRATRHPNVQHVIPTCNMSSQRATRHPNTQHNVPKYTFNIHHWIKTIIFAFVQKKSIFKNCCYDIIPKSRPGDE